MFYKYLSPEAAIAVLSTRRLRWSSPLTFNDPFDITQHLRLNFTAEELQRTLVEEVVRLHGTPGPLGPAIDFPLRLLHASLSQQPDRARFLLR